MKAKESEREKDSEKERKKEERKSKEGRDAIKGVANKEQSIACGFKCHGSAKHNQD